VLLVTASFSLSQDKQDCGQAVDNPDYVIGPEDVLYIQVWKEEALTRTVR